MEHTKHKFCGQPVSVEDLALIKELAVEFWGIPRSELAATICELLEWERPNGKLKTCECTFFLEDLEAKGILTLLRKRQCIRGKMKPIGRTKSAEEQEPVDGDLSSIGEVTLEAVKTDEQQKLFKEPVDRYHYLGYPPVWCAATLPGKRREGTGSRLSSIHEPRLESTEQGSMDRLECIKSGNQASVRSPEQAARPGRFLILPWVKVPHLVSHILGKVARRLPMDWQDMYAVRPLLMETFVEERFAETSYRAANWIELGKTRGRGRMDKDHKYEKAVKTVWGIAPSSPSTKAFDRGLV
jgi:hypothetical protein